MPASSPDIVVPVPVPVEVLPPGVLVIVQVPVAGRPLKATLPVATAHVGWVIVPVTGGDIDAGCEFITTLPDGAETQPAVAATVKV
jgi:hypothetical protein